MGVKLPECTRTPIECLQCEFTDVCDKEPSIDDYYISDDIEKSTKARKGHSSAEYMREWKETNSSHVKEYNRKYRETHSDEAREYHRAWIADNWLRKKLYDQKYRDSHREEMRRKDRERYWKKKAESA